MSKRTALYRHFDADGALLYVGIALSPTYRLSSHRAASEWATKIAHVTMEWFDSRADALAAEKRAIQTERPRHNIVHNKPSGDKPSGSRAAVPAVPEILYSKEQVAVYLQIGYATVQKLIADGMPRTQTGPRSFEYDMGAIKLWLRAKYTHTPKIDPKVQERLEARRVREAAAAARKAENAALNLQKMRDALMMIGRSVEKLQEGSQK